MKKLIALFALAALTAQAQTNKNYWWEGNSYQAHSTNYISETITPLGDGLIQFDLITQGCVRGTGGGGHADDCDAPWGTVYRSQLSSKTALPMDKHLEYSFEFNNMIPGDLSIMAPGWNTFVIQTLQSDERDGYMKIIHNGKVIVDYKGRTTYNAIKGVEYWIGAYVCCSFTKKNEPNHSFLFKNVRTGLGHTPPKPKISL